ncbi:MAG: universal stress protein [Dehalococcoidia bacterium]|nr:universal stress protein [Dehalococcoidia bacterium]
MLQKILVPLDGSKLAEIALPYAEEIAGRLVSDIKIVNVTEVAEDPFRNMRQVYLQQVAEATKHGAEKFQGAFREREIRVEPTILASNDPALEIVDYADREGIGLIVMATRGQSGLKRWVLGSVADRVVRVTEKPVALIRAKRTPQDKQDNGIFGKALVCLDGSKESEVIIPHIEEIASQFKTEVVLLEVLEKGYYFVKAGGYEYVFHPEKETQSAKALAKDYLDKVGERLNQKGIVARSEVKIGDAAEEIIKFADEISADVVAMATHGRSGISRWAMGSVANKVLHEGNTPLLLVRSPKTK